MLVFFFSLLYIFCVEEWEFGGFLKILLDSLVILYKDISLGFREFFNEL